MEEHAERHREEPRLQIDSGQNNVEARYIFAGRLTENNDDCAETGKCHCEGCKRVQIRRSGQFHRFTPNLSVS